MASMAPLPLSTAGRTSPIGTSSVSPASVTSRTICPGCTLRGSRPASPTRRRRPPCRPLTTKSPLPAAAQSPTATSRASTRPAIGARTMARSSSLRAWPALARPADSSSLAACDLATRSSTAEGEMKPCCASSRPRRRSRLAWSARAVRRATSASADTRLALTSRASSRASGWPALTVSPTSASTSVTRPVTSATTCGAWVASTIARARTRVSTGVLAAVVSDTVTGGGPLAAGPVSDGPEQAASRKVRQASGRIRGMATRQSGK